MTRSPAIIPRRAAYLAALLILTLCGIVHAAFPWESLELRGSVNDTAGLLAANERAGLEARLDEYNRQSGNALVLVTLGDLAGGDIDDAANRIFARAGIGQKGKDNGVLLLVSLNDHKMRIEVGYGLEAVLTDAQCSAIMRRDLVPAFRAGRYYEGIDAAFSDMRTLLGGGSLPDNPGNAGKALHPGAMLLFFFIFLPLMIVALLLSKVKQASSGWHRSAPFHTGGGHNGFGGGFSGGGGFGGFGGGMSGGGGASGGW